MDSPPTIRAEGADAPAGSPPGGALSGTAPSGAAPSGAARLRTNLAALRARVEAAKARGSHPAASVDVVWVTKAVPAAWLAWLPQAGARDVGENRVPAAVEKREALPVDLVRSLVWHGIGHLQTNKARRALDAFDVFHALDSLRLAERLDALLEETGRTPERPWPVYAQVNAARDPKKGGVEAEEAGAFLAALEDRPRLRVVGLMTMAREDDPAGARAAFRALREVRDEAVRRGVGRAAPLGLSMGMSDDFEAAVEEGATVLRIGRAAWEGVGTAEEAA
jgi:PLP dependent protein